MFISRADPGELFSKIGRLPIELDNAYTTIKDLNLNIQQLTTENIKLRAINTELGTKVELLEIVNKRQHDVILQLEKRLKVDSSNSSLSSSHDKFSKKRTINDRDKSNKSSGGQLGHKGENLSFETNSLLLSGPQYISIVGTSIIFCSASITENKC